MRRREFITLVGGAVASPLVARAQQPAKMKRLAMVHQSEPVSDMDANRYPFYRAFFDEVSRAGYVEGKNLVVERYSALGQPDRFTQLARDVVDTRPDAIYAFDPLIAVLCKATTTTIPIVTITSDPMALGLASSIARPGGNVTGISIDTGGSEIWGKRIGLIREVLPKLSKLSVLTSNPKAWEGPYGSTIREAAKAARIELNAQVLDGKINAASYQRAFEVFEQDRPNALMVTESPVHFTNRATIIELAAKHRFPVMYTWREFVDDGGLIAYSFDTEELGRTSGYQVAQIFRGTNPGDVPFIQVTRLVLALNLKTAKSLGIEFPATLLGSADFIIE
jgi:putative tryptophan/tyrosine transport system substrate-binding protein